MPSSEEEEPAIPAHAYGRALLPFLLLSQEKKAISERRKEVEEKHGLPAKISNERRIIISGEEVTKSSKPMFGEEGEGGECLL